MTKSHLLVPSALNLNHSTVEAAAPFGLSSPNLRCKSASRCAELSLVSLKLDRS